MLGSLPRKGGASNHWQLGEYTIQSNQLQLFGLELSCCMCQNFCIGLDVDKILAVKNRRLEGKTDLSIRDASRCDQFRMIYVSAG